MRLTRDKPSGAESAVTVAAELQADCHRARRKSADAQQAAIPTRRTSGSRVRWLAGLLVLVAIGALLWLRAGRHSRG
jgi:hypothetical protein